VDFGVIGRHKELHHQEVIFVVFQLQKITPLHYKK